MEQSLRFLPWRQLLSIVSGSYLEGEDPGQIQLGDVLLHAHQREAVSRIESAFERYGSAS